MQLVFLAFQVLEESPNAPEFTVIAVNDVTLLVGRQVLPRDIQWNTSCAGVSAHFGRQRFVLGFRPRFNGTIRERQRLVRNHQIQIEVYSVAKTLAAWTGAERIVEREEPRFGLFITDVA